MVIGDHSGAPDVRLPGRGPECRVLPLVWTKISVDEPWEDGINLDEAKIFILEVAKLVDAIETSGGTIV
ncbi:hypothetical protein [Rhodococcus opacus]|uniref:hypothetical protein n=1 Tax=Rhodococcus opacus TaxID=37919 RepID=UPI0022362269|nr:hypothetical protein [Rhodococcus opacus]UZG60308.1 hypothetical protein ONE62_42325 [Rhodococcus opacus]